MAERALALRRKDLQAALPTVQRMPMHEVAPSPQSLAGLHYQSAPLQRRPSDEAATLNGITAGENHAVRALSGGQVDLHAAGARLLQVPANDARLQAVQARSIAQGRTAMVSSSADRGHELWHLAQQAMHQVAPLAMVNGQPLNDDPRLEGEADRMGTVINGMAGMLPAASGTSGASAAPQASDVVQCARTVRTKRRAGKAARSPRSHLKSDKFSVRAPSKGMVYIPNSVLKELEFGSGDQQQKIHLTRLRVRRKKISRDLKELRRTFEFNSKSSSNAMDETPSPPVQELQAQPEQGITVSEEDIARRLNLDTETALSDWFYLLLPWLSGDQRKSIAAQTFCFWIQAMGNDVDGGLVERELAGLKELFGLSAAYLGQREGACFAAFEASPPVYVPLTAASYQSTYAGASPGLDKLEPTKFDKDLPTPAGQFIKQFNDELASKVYNTATGAKIAKLKDTQQNQTLLKSYPNSRYDRPGAVEAIITKAKPKPGRTGSGETEIGWFGRDEEQLITGKTSVPYEGGHLVGDQVMDGNNIFLMYQSWNLAPQAKSFNNPLYITSMENAAVKALKGGAKLEYKVEVQYPGGDYVLPAQQAVTNAVKHAETMPFSSDTYVDAVNQYLALNPSLNLKFTFKTRVPNYWKATMVDLNKKAAISGSARNDPRGPFSASAIASGAAYALTGVEQFTFGLMAGGVQLALPTTGPKSKQNTASYSGVDEVTLTAHQKSFVV